MKWLIEALREFACLPPMWGFQAIFLHFFWVYLHIVNEYKIKCKRASASTHNMVLAAMTSHGSAMYNGAYDKIHFNIVWVFWVWVFLGFWGFFVSFEKYPVMSTSSRPSPYFFLKKWIYVCTYVHMYICTDVCMYVGMHLHTYEHIFAHTYIHIHIYMFVWTFWHTCMCIY